MVGNSYGLIVPRETPPNMYVIGPVLPLSQHSDLSGHADLLEWIGSYDEVIVVGLGTVTRWDEQQMSAMLTGDVKK